MCKVSPNAIVMLLKFVQNNSKYLNDFESGNLYFSSLQSFIDLELKQGNSKTGDRNEGNIHQVFNDLKSLKVNDFIIPTEDINGVTADYSLPSDLKKNLGICSFFAVQFKDLERIDDYTNKYRLKHSVMKDLYKTKDGDRTLFAVNNVQRLQQECRDNNLGYGLVKYYDPNHIKNLDDLRKYPEFCKIDKYSFQHEFRIIKSLDDEINLNYLKAIKDGSFKSNILSDLNDRKNN